MILNILWLLNHKEKKKICYLEQRNCMNIFITVKKWSLKLVRNTSKDQYLKIYIPLITVDCPSIVTSSVQIISHFSLFLPWKKKEQYKWL